MVEALQRVLPAGALELDLTDSRVDATAVLPDGAKLPLTFKWAGEGYPRDVDRALRAVAAANPESTAARAQTIVFAHAVSKNVAEVLRDRGLSWVGLDGSASLHLGTVWIERSPSLERTTAADRRSFAWTPARLDIAEALLAATARAMVPVDERPSVPRVEALRDTSGRSIGAVAKALAEFDRQGWTGPGGKARGRVLRSGASLLDSWSRWSASHHEPWRMYHSLHRDPGRIVRALQEACGEAVFITGLTASQLVVPTTTDNPVVSAYVAVGRDGWQGVDARLSREDFRSSERGTVRLAPASPVISNFRDHGGGIQTASPVRVYADLLAGFSREVEAAEAYRAATLGSLG